MRDGDVERPVDAIKAAFAALESDAVFQSLKSHVQTVMSNFDASHDFDHVMRVLKMAHNILLEEECGSTAEGADGMRELDITAADPRTVYYAALLHDLFDRKYASKPSDGSIKAMLVKHGRDESWAARIEDIVENISYTFESNNPERARQAIATYPELAIVQDSDRLDAIGAIGIGRVFTYGGAKVPQRGMQGSVDHFTTKLEKLEGMMKTQTGKRIAKERTERLNTFRSWWDAEMSVSH